MAEIVDDSKPFTVKLAALGLLKIIQVVSEKEEYAEGEEVVILTTVKNTGATKCQAKVCMYDADTKAKIDCEAYKGAWGAWGGMEPDQQEIFEVNTKWAVPPRAMPDHDWKLRLDAVRQT